MLFEQQVQTLNVELSTIQKQQQNTYKSTSISDWIRLLSIYKLNQNWKQVDKCVLQMQKRFLLKQSFWIRQFQERINRLIHGNIQQLNFILQLISKAFEHGQYVEFAKKVAQNIIKLFSNKQISFNIAQSKLEFLISIFCWELKEGATFFQFARQLCRIAQKKQKIRNLYQRSIKIPYQTIDIIFDEYKNWQKVESQFLKTKQIYEVIKFESEQLNTSIKNKNYQKIKPEIRLCFYERDTLKQDQFLQMIKLISVEKRLLILKRKSKSGNYILKYLKQLQLQKENQIQLLNQEYNRIIYSQTNNFSLKQLFLFAIVRRINKHLFTLQNQEYLNTWGEKVVYFRQQVQKFINQSMKNQQQQFLYTYWLQVQSYIIKDKQAVKNIFQRLKNQPYTNNIYKKCSNGLISLGQIVQAKKVLQIGTKFSKNKQECIQELVNFQYIFGNIRQMQLSQPNQIIPTQKSLKRNREAGNEIDQTSLKIQQLQKKRFHGDGNKTLYLKGISVEWKQKDIINLFQHKQQIKQVRLIKGKDQKIKDYCYVDFYSQQIAQQQCSRYKENPTIKMFLSKPPKQYDAQERTLFLCALPQTANEAKIREVLADFQDQIQDIRLVKNDQGTKGYCYVQFFSIEQKQNAFQELAKRKITIDNKKVLIQECDSDRTKSKKLNTVVFLRGIAFKAKESDIIQFFKQKHIQNIKLIEIPKDDKNKSKGIAYVEFSKFKDYQNALDLKIGNILKRDFEILRSDRVITKKNQGPKGNQDFRKLLNG